MACLGAHGSEKILAIARVAEKIEFEEKIFCVPSGQTGSASGQVTTSAEWSDRDYNSGKY